MSWSKRIDSKKYFFGTSVNIGFAVYAGYPSFLDAWWLTFVCLSAVLNHYFTVKAVSRLINDRAEPSNAQSSTKLIFYFVFKTIFLAAGFICLLMFARNKIIQGLLIYIFQLIILALSIKNIGKFYKKGSST